MKPFDIVADVSFKKQRLVNDELTEKQYQPFLINRALSYFSDTILYAQEMNKNIHLDNQLQFDYLFCTIRKRNRFSKWVKKVENEDISAIQEYYGFSYQKALDALKVLNPSQVSDIKRRLEKGGAR